LAISAFGANGEPRPPPASNVTASKDLVGFCPADKKRLFRFVGEDVPAEGSLLFLRCGT